MREDISHRKGQKRINKKAEGGKTLLSQKMSMGNHKYSTHTNKSCHHSTNALC